MAITNEAKEELKNELNIQQIDEGWKKATLSIVQYFKGSELKGHAMGKPEEISQLLEDNILILQSLSASKYVRSIKTRVNQWEKDLNTISDVLSAWM
jgi:hypothetical protein